MLSKQKKVIIEIIINTKKKEGMRKNIKNYLSNMRIQKNQQETQRELKIYQNFTTKYEHNIVLKMRKKVMNSSKLIEC